MPEGTEIRAFKEYLLKHGKQKIKIKIIILTETVILVIGWTVVHVQKMANHARYEQAIASLIEALPLKIKHVSD
jgi:Tfp pilus assembly protein PilO